MLGKRLTAIALMLAAGFASAHRGHDSLSEVQIDDESREVTVTHYFTAHDLEPALKQIAPHAQPSLDDPQAIEALISYVARRFSLEETAGLIVLRLAETKLSADQVELIYRGRMQAVAGALRVRAQLLTDIYPDQHNQVNVRRGGMTRTAVFEPGTEAQTLP